MLQGRYHFFLIYSWTQHQDMENTKKQASFLLIYWFLLLFCYSKEKRFIHSYRWRQWIMTMDCGLWRHLIVVLDPDRGGCWSLTIILLDIQYTYSHTLPLLTITSHLIYFPLCYKLFILINVVNTVILLMFSVACGIYCTSVHLGRGIPHMQRFW